MEDYQDVEETLEKAVSPESVVKGENQEQSAVKVAAAMVCLKNSPVALQTLREELAAIRIQTAFRGFLVSSFSPPCRLTRSSQLRDLSLMRCLLETRLTLLGQVQTLESEMNVRLNCSQSSLCCQLLPSVNGRGVLFGMSIVLRCRQKFRSVRGPVTPQASQFLQSFALVTDAFSSQVVISGIVEGLCLRTRIYSRFKVL